MVETPSAALLADDMLAVVDFVSLGTNDLAQYTMAADRLSGELAALNDPWQPAVLRLIALVGAAGGRTGVPVGVCGEAAGDPLLAVVLVGLGATSLSMAPGLLGAVATQLATVDRAACERAAAAAVAATDPAGARTAVQAALGR
jgi:phosphoenolpyruvate-protein kinase (PTS system EI component)